MSYGFKPDLIEDAHFTLGSGKITERFGAAKLIPNGHGWGDYLPSPEDQRRYGFETSNCVGFGTLSALETLARYHGFSDFPAECSDRYTGTMAGTTTSGNSPHTVIESIRTLAGVVPEDALPWTADIDSEKKYYAPKPMLTSLIAMGQIVLKNFTIGHEWTFNAYHSLKEKQERMKEALTRGTVCASVQAWHEQNGRYYKKHGTPDNHWIHVVDYKDGKYWLIRDQYSPFEKKLEWDYDFQQSKIYFLSRKSESTVGDFALVLSLMVYNLKSLLQILANRLGLWT